MGLSKERLQAAGLAIIGAAALFPYHFATLQAIKPGAGSWALLTLAVTIPAFALIVREVRALLAHRELILATLALAAILVAAEIPFAQAGVAAVGGLALVQAFLIVLFAAAAWSVAKEALARSERPEPRTLWAVGLLFFAVAGIFAFWLRSSHFVWYYDYATHPLLARDLIGMIHEGGLIVGGLGAVQDSLKLEYNMVPVAPIALVEALVGQSRLLFILGIALLYAAPTIIAGAALLRRCAPAGLGGREALLIFSLSALIFPAAFYSALYGQPDLGGAGILATLFTVAFARAPSRDLARMVVCGGLIILLFVFRRWYVFLAPAIVIIIAVSEFRRNEGQALRRRMVATALALAIFGSFAALCGFAFVWDRFLLMATNDYAGAYAAWANPAPVEIAHALEHFGYGPLALFLACALFLLARPATRLAGLATLATPLLVIVLFERVQGFAVHHYLLLIPFMVFAVALAAAQLAQARPRVVAAALAAGAAASLLSVSSPGAGTAIQQARIVPTVDMTPPRRDDMAELGQLVRDLARHADSGEKVCVIAATWVLNATIIRETAFVLPEAQSLLGENFVWLGEVDRRDKDYLPKFTTCDVAVVPDPLQARLAVREQQLIAFPDGAIKSRTGLGVAFQPLGEVWRLTNGVEARLYRRTATIAAEDMRVYAGAVAKTSELAVAPLAKR